MPELRDLLLEECQRAACGLGDCPTCHGLGRVQRVVGVDEAENDLVRKIERCWWCGGSGWLRRPTLALPHLVAGAYVAGETRPGATNGGTSANDSVGAGLVSQPEGASNAHLHGQVRAAQPGSQDGRLGPPTRLQGAPAPAGRGGYRPGHTAQPYTSGRKNIAGSVTFRIIRTGAIGGVKVG